MNWIKTAIVAGALLAMSAVSKGGTVTSIGQMQFSGKVTEINGLAPGYVGFPVQQEAILDRPGSATDQTLVLQNYYIHDLINQKALGITSSAEDAYANVLLQNVFIQNVTRNSAGVVDGQAVHTDFIRIAGWDSQNVPTNVTMNNVHIDNGASLPILITDGSYHDIVFNNVSITNTTLGEVQVHLPTVGHIDNIYIENSPGLRVCLMGRPGSIGTVNIFNSTGVDIGDMNVTGTGASGAKIIYDKTAPTIDSKFGAGLDLTPAVASGTSGIESASAASGSGAPGLGSDSSLSFGTGSIGAGPFLPNVGSPAPVPEPTSLGLFAVIGLVAFRRPRKA